MIRLQKWKKFDEGEVRKYPILCLGAWIEDDAIEQKW